MGDRGLDLAGAEQGTVRLRGVGLVAQDPVGSGAWPAGSEAGDADLVEQVREHRRISALTWTDDHHQRPAAAIDELMDLGRETTAGAAQRMVSWLDEQPVGRFRLIR